MSTSATAPFPMPACQGVPDGLSAYAWPSKSDGTFALDRKGRPTVTRIRVKATNATSPARPTGVVADRDWIWLTARPRRWQTVVDRFGGDTRAWEVCCALAHTGCGSIEHGFKNGTLQQPPLRWIPDPALSAEQQDRTAQRTATRSALVAEAAALSGRLAQRWPGVAAALLVEAADSQMLWLIRAAGDLERGARHDGVRAFVQVHHPEDDKAREDLPTLLRESGWEPEAIRELGVDRNPYIGVGGPVTCRFGLRTLDWTGWPGPHDLRLPHGMAIRLTCPPQTPILVVIENRQAAETICDRYPSVPVIWCRGHHSDRVLDVIGELAAHCRETLICTDADLGGLRITSRLYDRIGDIATVVDIGQQPHAAGRAFTSETLAKIAEFQVRVDEVGAFASAIASRGYAITQEALVHSALRQRLDSLK